MSKGFDTQFEAVGSSERNAGKGGHVIIHHELGKHFVEIHFTRGEWKLLKQAWEADKDRPLQSVIIDRLLADYE